MQIELVLVEGFQALERAHEQWSDCPLWCQQDVSHVWDRACEPLFCFYAREWASVFSISPFFFFFFLDLSVLMIQVFFIIPYCVTTHFEAWKDTDCST